MSRVPARPTGVALGAVLLSLALGASPALAAQRTATGKDSADDGIAGTSRDIVSTSFQYDDSGTLELTVTMAAPIDPQNARSQATWNVTEGSADRDCSLGSARPASQVTIQYDTAGTGGVFYSQQSSTSHLPSGTARIDGATLVYDITDPHLAGHRFSCLDTRVSAVRGDPQGANTSVDAPGDKAAAAVTGFAAPGPFVDLREAGKRVEATDSGVVRLNFDSSAYDRSKGVVTLRTAHKVRPKKSKPRRVLTLGSDDLALSEYGEKTSAKIRLTKEGRAFLNRAGRVAVVVTIVAKDAQGRKSTTEERITLESPPA